MKRTPDQNKSIHKYYELLAEELNNAGYDMRVFLEEAPKLNIPWTKESIKEMWRIVQIAMTGKESTADLDSTEVDKIYKVLDSRVSEITGVHIEFPSEESLHTGEKR